MKITRLALTLGATLLTSVAFAGVFTINPTPAPIAGGGGPTTPTPIAFVYTPAGGDATIAFQASIAFDITKVSATVTNGAGANGTGGNCAVASPGVIRIIAADNNNVALQAGTYCNLAFTSLAGFTTGTTPLTMTIAGAGKGCIDLNANPTTCTKVDGSLAVAAGGTAPTATIPATSTLTGGTGTVAVNVTAAGTAGGSLGLNCTIPPTAPSNFTITAGAGRTITGPATLGANAPAIGLTCVPGAAAVVATLSCAQTPTPASALAPLTSQVTCPAIAPATITPAPLGGTAAAPTTLTVANGTAQPIGTVINITGLTVTGAGFVAPATGSWGACVYSADATPPALTTSDPAAFTTGPQLVFNQANNATAQPLIIGATRRATQVSAILTCPVLPAATAPGATSNVYRLVLAAGVVPATAVSASTPSGPLTLPAFTVGAGSSSSNLTFTGTAGGSVACAFNPAAPGYTVAPNPLTLVGTTPGSVTVTYTGAAAGTFTGTLVCTVAAPGTGGPFTYNVSTTVNAPVAVNTVQVPTLGNISLMLLIAGFLGLGMVLVGRRQA